MFATLQYMLPQRLLTSSFGFLANSKNPFISRLLKNFIANKYGIDLSIAKLTSIDDYASLQELFTREIDLKHRDTVNIDDHNVISPADSSVSQIGNIDNDTLIQAKGFKFSLEALLGDSHFAREFTNGSYTTLYLAPHDYHRVHMPISGKLINQRFIPGKLFSVNNYTASKVNNLFARNERLCCIFETEHGLMAQIMVGAMIVGSIISEWGGNSHTESPNISKDFANGPKLAKGAHMGMFAFGSTVITLFQENKIKWDDKIKIGQKLEVMQPIGKLL